MFLSFPKCVEITNPRLNAVYYCGLCCLTASIAIKFYMLDEAYSSVSLDKQMRVAMWTKGVGDLESAEALFIEKLNSPLCQTPEMFDFWWDREGMFKYENYTCKPVCYPGKIDRDCISSQGAALIEGQESIFMPTQVKESSLIPNATGKMEDVQFYFNPSVEAYGVQFIYSYKMPDEADGYLSNFIITDNVKDASSAKNILTVLLDSNGNVIKSLEPSGSVSLTVPQLLSMSGDLQLDNTISDSWPNMKPNATMGTPSIRITGAELIIDVTCRNYKRPKDLRVV